MLYREIGDTGISASALGLGCGRFGSIASGVSGLPALRLLDEAYDLGVNFFDTADSYGQGESEALIGKAFRRKRDRVVITTKVGYRLRGAKSLLLAVKPLVRPVLRRLRGARRATLGVRPSVMGVDFTPRYIQRAAERSLRRLRTDHVDFYLLHNPPREVAGDGAVLETLESLKRSGKIRYYGFSCDDAEAGFAALENPGVRALEVPLSPLSDSKSEPFLETSLRRSVGLFVNRPFAAGSAPGASPPNGFERLAAAARDLGASRATLLLQFALRRKGVSVVLSGTTQSAHLRENVRAVTEHPFPPGFFDPDPSS